jgi:adenylate cyclase
MKYKHKLYLSFLIVALASAVLGLTISYIDTKRFATEEFRNKAMAIAATIAPFIPGDMIKEINGPEDTATPAYAKLKEELRNARENNQKEGLALNYIFILKPSLKNPDELIKIIGASEEEKEMIPVGTVYTSPRSALIRENKDRIFAPKHFLHDVRGFWLSGFAPILDSQGNYVATLIIDICAMAVEKEMNDLLVIGAYSLASAIIFGLITASLFSHFFSRSVIILSNAVKKIGKGDLEYKTKLNTKDEFHDLAEEINKMAIGLKERERLKMTFARYVSTHILEKVLQSDKPPHFQGERKKITVLFSDIRKFTHLAEKLAPEEVVAILNRYFGRMIEIVFKYNGTLDKFLGDGLMVEFGAPLDDKQQEKNAMRAALEMQQEAKEISDKWVQEGKPELKIGIGIHTGNAVVGNIGSEKHMEYTAIGDTVNVAARLEEATKEFNVSILVSEETYHHVKEDYPFKYVGELSLKGREEKIKAYTI